jgi:hypothetical protein
VPSSLVRLICPVLTIEVDFDNLVPHCLGSIDHRSYSSHYPFLVNFHPSGPNAIDFLGWSDWLGGRVL